MTERKRHLIVRVGQRRTACGVLINRAGREPVATTLQVQEVTCLGCQRTLLMADAEVRRVNRRRR